MSIRAVAGRTIFYYFNENREQAPIPIKFPDMRPDTGVSYCVWVYLTNNVPASLIVHEGKDGSKVHIHHDGTAWYLTGQQASVGLGTHIIVPIKLYVWSVICVIQNSGFYHVYYGEENLSVPTPWLNPLPLVYRLAAPVVIYSLFDHIALITTSSMLICNFKFWNDSLTQSQMQVQSHRWDAQTEGQGPAPIWACPMRSPGDVASIANPYASMYWGQGHDWSHIDTTTSNLTYMGDPQYMGANMPTPVWVYPTVFPSCFVDPGTTPPVTTVYKAPQFFEFHDRGAVTPTDHQIQSIVYYGSAFGGLDPGTTFSECWGLYKDDDSQEIATMGSPTYRFYPGDTVVDIPPGTKGAIKASTMYLWKFGGQFVYESTPAGPTNTGHLAYLLLLATYVGYPTGVPKMPVVDMAGLFAINNKPDKEAVDRYNRGVELKIPDPTVKTAYIGE